MRTIFFIVLLATTFIFCAENNGKIIGGDDHDYVPHGLIGGDDHDKVAYQYLQLKKTLKEKSLESLREYCLKLEAYQNEKTGQHFLGGLHDYINSMDRDACMEYISTSVFKNKELLDQNKFMGVVDPQQMIIGGDGHDEKAFAYLNLKKTWTEKTLGELKDYCLRVESYINAKTGKPVLGGLHDYIRSMNQEACIDYLSKAVFDNEELLNQDKFYSVARPAMIIGGDDHDIVAYKFLKLKESLKPLSIEELKDYCLKLESYIRSKSSEPFMGGVHDYINKMTKEDMMSYISEVALKNQELLDNEKFMSVVKPEQQKEVIVKAGGHHDIVAYKYLQIKAMLDTKSVEELKTTALNLEKYVNDKNGVHLIGGLHDYIGTWGKDECMQYISKVILNNEELLEKEAFLKAVSPLASLLFMEDQPLIGGGLHDLIRTMKRQELINYALTCEKYRNEKLQKKIRGGIHDYINRLSNEEIGQYVLDMADEYPELNNIQKLRELSATYGFTN